MIKNLFWIYVIVAVVYYTQWKAKYGSQFVDAEGTGIHVALGWPSLFLQNPTQFLADLGLVAQPRVLSDQFIYADSRN